jgi:LysR family nitrogen assimilation transcriptional regulator
MGLYWARPDSGDRRVDVRQLRYFAKVIELKSVTKAAAQLGIAQPALGLQMRNLERELATALLLRHSRGVAPTEAGEVLYAHARAILSSLDDAMRAVRDVSGPPRGRVAVGMAPNTNHVLATRLIRQAAKELPGVTLSILEERSVILAEWIESGRLTLALASGVEHVAALACEPLAIEDLFFIEARPAHTTNARKASPRAASPKGPISFAELARRPLILSTSPYGIRQIVERTAASRKLALQVAVEIVAFPAVLDLVERRVGATVLPLPDVADHVRAGRLLARPIVDPPLQRTLLLVRDAHRPLGRAESAVAALIRTLVAAQIGRKMTGWHKLD